MGWEKGSEKFGGKTDGGHWPAAVAQLVERLTSNQEVPSSILGGGLFVAVAPRPSTPRAGHFDASSAHCHRPDNERSSLLLNRALVHHISPLRSAIPAHFACIRTHPPHASARYTVQSFYLSTRFVPPVLAFALLIPALSHALRQRFALAIRFQGLHALS